jgi:hypothetical protein
MFRYELGWDVMATGTRWLPRRVWVAVPAALALVAAVVVGVQAARSTPAGAVGPAPVNGVPLRAVHSGKCLNVSGASLADKAAVVQYDCVGAANERWRAVPQDDGSYQLVAEHSGKCLNVSGASTADSAPVIQYRCTGTALNERWKPFQLPDSTIFTLVAAHSGKCINVSKASTANKAAIVQYRCTGTALNERWFSSVRGADAPAYPTAPVVAGTAGGAGDAVRIAYVDRTGAGFTTSTSLSPGEQVTWTPLPVSQRLTGQLALVGGRQLVAGGRNRIAWALDLDRADADWVDAGDAVDAGFSVAQFGPTPAVFGTNNGSARVLKTDGTHVPFLALRLSGGGGEAGIATAEAGATSTQFFGLDGFHVLHTVFLGSDGFVATPITVGSEPTSIGGPAAVGLPGFLYVAALSTSTGDVKYKWQTQQAIWPAAWTTLPGASAAGTPQLLRDATGRVNLVVRGTDGLLRVATETATGSRTFGPWAVASSTPSVSDPSVFPYTDFEGNHLWGITGRTADDQVFVITVRPPTATAAPRFTARPLPTS